MIEWEMNGERKNGGIKRENGGIKRKKNQETQIKRQILDKKIK